MLGKPSLYLLLAHGLLIAVGYGMAEGLDPISESVALWVLVPDMWLAFVSMGLFIAVVVTSLVAVRRRFPYEFWYAVHLLTYVAVGTSIPHQFSVGGLFAEGTWQRWYWLSICAVTGAALLYFRVGQPLAATSRHRLTVSRVERIAPGVARLRPGTKVAVEGPYGLFGTAARSRDKVVLIGAGIGITPLRALLEITPHAHGDATVLLRGSTEQELYLSDELLEICRRRGVRLFHLIGPRARWDSHSWLPADAVRSGYNLADYAPDIADADVYICGPSRWAGNVIAEARTAGARPEQIHHERFDW